MGGWLEDTFKRVPGCRNTWPRARFLVRSDRETECKWGQSGVVEGGIGTGVVRDDSKQMADQIPKIKE